MKLEHAVYLLYLSARCWGNSIFECRGLDTTTGYVLVRFLYEALW